MHFTFFFAFGLFFLLSRAEFSHDETCILFEFFSGDKIFTLYEELQTSDVPAHVMDHFQDLISALVTDVKKIEQKNKLLEERFQK